MVHQRALLICPLFQNSALPEMAPKRARGHRRRPQGQHPASSRIGQTRAGREQAESTTATFPFCTGRNHSLGQSMRGPIGNGLCQRLDRKVRPTGLAHRSVDRYGKSRRASRSRCGNAHESCHNTLQALLRVPAGKARISKSGRKNHDQARRKVAGGSPPRPESSGARCLALERIANPGRLGQDVAPRRTRGN